MTTLFLLCLFPLLWPWVAKRIWPHELTLAEVGVNILIGVTVATVGWGLGHYAQVHDNQVLSSQLQEKYHRDEICEHTYTCNCREVCSGSGQSRSCSTSCDTCREHSYDRSWFLSSDIGSVEIPRVDRRGLTEPPRFSRAQIGEPFSVVDSYINYIKAAPHSLFHHLLENKQLTELMSQVPAYPLAVRDFHYVDRVVASNVSVPDLSVWNEALALSLKTLGPQKQANLVVVLSGHKDAEFASALEAKWLGGKKNDVVVVLGVPEYPAIGWVRVLSWTDEEIFKVRLRDALLDAGKATPQATIALVSEHIQKGFVRKPMSDFEYLKHEVELSPWVIAFLVLISMAASFLATHFLVRNQYTTASGYSRYRRPSSRFKPTLPKFTFRR